MRRTLLGFVTAGALAVAGLGFGGTAPKAQAADIYVFVTYHYEWRTVYETHYRPTTVYVLKHDDFGWPYHAGVTVQKPYRVAVRKLVKVYDF